MTIQFENDLANKLVNVIRDHHPGIVPDEALIGATEARRLAGNVSDMTLWRWMKDGIIPQPTKIRRRNYWKRGEFIAALSRPISAPAGDETPVAA